MADQTKIIKQDGSGDYTTIQACFAAADVSTGFWKCEIQDNGTYGHPDLVSITGVPTADKNLILTVAEANRHPGYLDGNAHAQIENDESGHDATQIHGVPFVRIEHMDIYQNNLNGSDGCIVVRYSDDVTIENCILRTDCDAGANRARSAIYTYSGPGTGGGSDKDIGPNQQPNQLRLNISNCVMYGFKESGIHAYCEGGIQSINVDLCTISNSENGIIISNIDGGTTTLNIFNTMCVDINSVCYGVIEENINFGVDASGGTEVWAGSNNVAGDSSLTAIGLTTDAIEGVVINTDVFFWNSSACDANYTLNSDLAANLPYLAGIDRVGSEPDSTQDFSVDASGVARPSPPSIGAIEYLANVANQRSIGVSGSITDEFGVSSRIDEDGQGVEGEIDSNGQGVEGSF